MSGHNDRKHHKFSPSQSERFRVCYGSTNLLARVPARPSSEYAIGGTKAHEVLDAALVNRVRKAREAHTEYSSLCMEDLNTRENNFYFSIQVALNHIYAILDESNDAILYNERKVTPPTDNAPGEAAGYCDVAIYIPSKRILYVIDYKHGAGITKAVEGNTQVMQYAEGFLFGDDAPVDPAAVDTVVLTIIQPRAFHPDGAIREYELSPSDLYIDLLELDEAIAENLKPDAPLVPDDGGRTTDHCRFCDANTVCPAREAKAVKAIGTQFNAVPEIRRPDLPVPSSLDLDKLSFISMHAPMLRKFLDDVDAHIEQLLRAGHGVPGKKLVAVSARRQWHGDPMETAHKLASLADVPVEDIMEWKLIPITNAEKLVIEAFKRRVGRGRKNKAAEEARNAMAFLTLKQSSGNLTVVDENDPRPPVNRAATDFAQISAVLPAPKETQET